MVYNIYIYHDKYSITRAPLSNDNETGYNGYTNIFLYLSLALTILGKMMGINEI